MNVLKKEIRRIKFILKLENKLSYKLLVIFKLIKSPSVQWHSVDLPELSWDDIIALNKRPTEDGIK